MSLLTNEIEILRDKLERAESEREEWRRQAQQASDDLMLQRQRTAILEDELRTLRDDAARLATGAYEGLKRSIVQAAGPTAISEPVGIIAPAGERVSESPIVRIGEAGDYPEFPFA